MVMVVVVMVVMVIEMMQVSSLKVINSATDDNSKSSCGGSVNGWCTGDSNY